MLVYLAVACLAYVSVFLMLSASRFLKLVDLHQEFQIVRAREQRTHIKNHAQALVSGIKSDIVWPVSIFKNLKLVQSWLREK
jgi:hypothetical protein